MVTVQHRNNMWHPQSLSIGCTDLPASAEVMGKPKQGQCAYQHIIKWYTTNLVQLLCTEPTSISSLNSSVYYNLLTNDPSDDERARALAFFWGWYTDCLLGAYRKGLLASLNHAGGVQRWAWGWTEASNIGNWRRGRRYVYNLFYSTWKHHYNFSFYQ